MTIYWVHVKLAFMESRVRGPKHEFLYLKCSYFPQIRYFANPSWAGKYSILQKTEDPCHRSTTVVLLSVMKSHGTILLCHDVNLFCNDRETADLVQWYTACLPGCQLRFWSLALKPHCNTKQNGLLLLLSLCLEFTLSMKSNTAHQSHQNLKWELACLQYSINNQHVWSLHQGEIRAY